jgi:hypothetical protein
VSLPVISCQTGILILLVSCFLFTGTASAQGIHAYMGDTIPLSGYSSSSPLVYLFLTGPNLPPDGVALNNINLLADEGGFTRVDVNGGNDMWSYEWATNSLGGRLDAGTYTIWVVDGPNDLSNLANADYATISVTLDSPTLSVTTPSPPVVPPSLEVSSTPDDSSVSADGRYLGKTPFSTDNLGAGTYTVTVSRFGFGPYTTNVSLVNGMITVINASLPAMPEPLRITTVPSGANISIDGNNAGTSPVTVPDLVPGNHTVNVTKAGYIPSAQLVTIAPGLTSRLAVNLTPSSPLAGILSLKTSWPMAGMLLGLCAAVVILAYRRAGSR